MPSAASPGRPGIDLDLARTFVAICDSGNFSKAAERVHRTPSAVSLQVKRLEDMLGRALFRREARSVVLTADGEMLLGYARRLLALSDEAMAHFVLPPMEGKVRLGAPFDSGVIAIPAILARFATTHPQVQVDVRLGSSRDLRQRCLAGDLDLALFSLEDTDPATTTVHTEELVWVGRRHGEAARRRPLPLALADSGCIWRAKALAVLDAAGIPVRIAYSSEHCQGQIAAVEADLAVAPLPLSVVSPPFVRLGPADGLPRLGSYDVQMLRREGAGAVTDALAQHVAANFADIGSRGRRLFA
jgi:DNA-binding transcriptional LysR family regulator